MPTRDLERIDDPAADEDPDAPDQHTEDQLELALAAMGLRPVQPLPGVQEGGRVVCWPENLPAILHWMAVQTQWRLSPASGLGIGLDYAGVCAYLQAQGYRHHARAPLHLGTMLDDIRCMERATLDEQAERQRRKGRP